MASTVYNCVFVDDGDSYPIISPAYFFDANNHMSVLLPSPVPRIYNRRDRVFISDGVGLVPYPLHPLRDATIFSDKLDDSFSISDHESYGRFQPSASFSFNGFNGTTCPAA